MAEGEQRGFVPEAFIGGLLDAAFGGDVPGLVAGLVDPTVAARHLDGSKLGVVALTGPDEHPHIRLAHDDERDRLSAAVTAQWPDAAAFLDAHGETDLLFDTDGTKLRILCTGLPERPVDGGVVIGASWTPMQGHKDVVGHEGLPGDLPDGLATACGAFADQVSGGQWLSLRDASGVRSVVWTSDGAWDDAHEAVIAGFGLGDRLQAVHAHYAANHLRVAPYAVEWFDNGAITVCAWGAHKLTDGSDLPEAFTDGVVPSAELVGQELAVVLPDDHREAGEAFARDHLYDVLVAICPEDVDAYEHFVGVWRWMIDRIAFEAPTERLGALRKIARANQLPGLQRRAFHLAMARYMASHPDAMRPADLPDELAALDAAAIAERARVQLEAFASYEDEATSDPAFDAHRYQEIDCELPTVKDLLERAVSGEFAGATGPLHGFLVELGATGYDDDPSLISLDDIDLEADRDAAIEEALAMDDDEDF